MSDNISQSGNIIADTILCTVTLLLLRKKSVYSLPRSIFRQKFNYSTVIPYGAVHILKKYGTQSNLTFT